MSANTSVLVIRNNLTIIRMFLCQLTGKEKHGRNTIKDLNSLSAILKSLDELQIYMSSLNVEKYRAKFYDLKATFLETENIPNKKAPNTSPDSP